MPSGKFHDVVTLLLTPAAFGAGIAAFGTLPLAATAAAAFAFGGFMFGPDLDTVSKQYSRWGIFRFFWLPYRKFFSHRSRWSHGLIFGSLLRSIYFIGVITLAAFALAMAWHAAAESAGPEFLSFVGIWQTFGITFREKIGAIYLAAVFGGLWLGAASHTFTDMAVSYVKTGRITEFL